MEQANGGLNVRNSPNGSIVGGLISGSEVTIYETSDSWARIGENQWVYSKYLVEENQTTNITVGETKKIKVSTLYSNSDLTGINYSYKSNTTVTILENVSTSVDKIRVNVTGRIAYINTDNYIDTMQTSTVNQVKRLKACTLYSEANLTGTQYQYKNNTSVVVLENISSSVDKIRVRVTGRIAYINVNNYK